MIDTSMVLSTDVLSLDPNVLYGIAAIAGAVIPSLATVAVAYLKRRRR